MRKLKLIPNLGKVRFALIFAGGFAMGGPLFHWIGWTPLTEVALHARIVLSAVLLVGALIVDQLEEIGNALAKGQASQGTREPRWESTQTKIIYDQKVRQGHYHRGFTVGTFTQPPFKYEDCPYFKGGVKCGEEY